MLGAYLAFQNRTYFSRASRPVLALIQGIYDRYPEMARKMVRSRIFTSVPPTEAELGMLKVAAKRLSMIQTEDVEIPSDSEEVVPLPPPRLLNESDLNPAIGKLLKDQRYRAASTLLAESIPRSEDRYRSDRPVAALLLSHDGQLLGAAVNTNAVSRTRHAEMNLVQGYLIEVGAPLPDGAQIYVTLKCCKMCAAMIWESCKNPLSLRIYYSEDDPGPNAHRTVFTPGSLERKRVTSDPEAQIKPVEFKVTN